MAELIAIEGTAAAESCGVITYWSLSGSVSWQAFCDSLRLEGVAEADLPWQISSGEALARAARACCTDRRQLVRPLGQRGAWAFVQEQLEGERKVGHRQLLTGYVERVKQDGGGSVEVIHVDYADGVERTEALDELRDQIIAEQADQLQQLNGSDVGDWLVYYCRQLHATSLRDRGGMYFVPRDVLSRWRAVCRAVGEETLHRIHQIPAMKTEEAVEAILSSVRDTVQGKFRELESYLAEGVSTKGLNAWDRNMAETRSYLEHYVRLLGQALPDLSERLEQLTGALTSARLVANAEQAA